MSEGRLVFFLFVPLAGLVFFLFLTGIVALSVHRRFPAFWPMLLVVPMIMLILPFGVYVLSGPVVFARRGPAMVGPPVDSLPRGARPQSAPDSAAAMPSPHAAVPALPGLTGKGAEPRHAARAEAEETPAATSRAEPERALEPAGGDATSAAKAPGAGPPEAAGPSGWPPEWLGAPPRRTEAGYQISVATDPFATPLECDRQLPEVLRRAVAQYVALYLGDEAAAAQIELPAEFIRTEIVKAQWEEPFQSSIGPMVRLHALLVFDRKINARIDEAYQRLLAEHRVWQLGVIVTGVLGALAAAWAYLRLDLATAGRYRWRLRLAAAAAILAVVAAGWAVLG